MTEVFDGADIHITDIESALNELTPEELHAAALLKTIDDMQSFFAPKIGIIFQSSDEEAVLAYVTAQARRMIGEDAHHQEAD